MSEAPGGAGTPPSCAVQTSALTGGEGVAQTRDQEAPGGEGILTRQAFANVRSLSNAGLIALFSSTWDEAARRELRIPLDNDLRDCVLEAVLGCDLDTLRAVLADTRYPIGGGGTASRSTVGRPRTSTRKNFQRASRADADRVVLARESPR